MAKLITPDGKEMDEADVQQTFAEAMAAPEPDEPLAKAPQPKDDQAAPQASPKEPAAADGKARTRAAAPQTGERKRRTRNAAAAAPSSAPSEGAYVKPVAEFLEGLTVLGVVAPLPSGPLATRLRLQAKLVDDFSPGLAKATDLAARHNAVIRRGVESLTMGSAGWVLPAVMLVGPFAMASVGLWRAPVTEDMVKAGQIFETEVKAALATMGQPDASPAA